MANEVARYEALNMLLPGSDWQSKAETIAWLTDSNAAAVADVLGEEHVNTGRRASLIEAEFDALASAHARLCSFNG